MHNTWVSLHVGDPAAQLTSPGGLVEGVACFTLPRTDWPVDPLRVRREYSCLREHVGATVLTTRSVLIGLGTEQVGGAHSGLDGRFEGIRGHIAVAGDTGRSTHCRGKEGFSGAGGTGEGVELSVIESLAVPLVELVWSFEMYKKTRRGDLELELGFGVGSENMGNEEVGGIELGHAGHSPRVEVRNDVELSDVVDVGVVPPTHVDGGDVGEGVVEESEIASKPNVSCHRAHLLLRGFIEDLDFIVGWAA